MQLGTPLGVVPRLVPVAQTATQKRSPNVFVGFQVTPMSMDLIYD